MLRIVSRLTAFLVAGAVLAAAPAAAEKRVALVIGNSAYEHAGLLRNPANDAADMSAVLQRLNFEVTTVIDAKGGALSDALARFADTIQGSDVALFWYAGHGIQYNNANYLLPIDAKLDNEFAVRRETFAFTDIIRRMETASKMSLVFIDACRNTPLADKLKASLGTSDRAASVGRGLARVENQAPDTLIVFATAPGEVAEDGTGRNSPFAEAMLKHIETPSVDVEVMLKDVTSDVRRATRERQRPERLSRLESKFMFVGGKQPEAKAEAEPEPDAETPANAALDTAADESRDAAKLAEERNQGAAREASDADRRRQEAEDALRAAEERKRVADEETRKRKDADLDRRREVAEREAREAEDRQRIAEAEAAEAEARWRKAEAEARAAELRAKQAEAAAGRDDGNRSASLERNQRDLRVQEDRKQNDTPQQQSSGEQQARASTEATLWDHNGSTVYLTIEGGTGRRFRYVNPRRGVQQEGARRGTVLYEGFVNEKKEWVGTAYVFSRNCGPSSYAVEGESQEGGRRVTLRGRAPKVDESCQVVSHRDDVLVFNRVQHRD